MNLKVANSIFRYKLCEWEIYYFSAKIILEEHNYRFLRFQNSF